MRTMTLEEIRGSSARDLITALRKREFSLLLSLGFKKLRAEMILTGLLCRLIMFCTGLSGALRRAGEDGIRRSSRAYKRTRRFLQIVAPVDCYGAFPHQGGGIVIGFNHPSLGELLRCIHICMTEYRFQHNLFPVNLPWYEALMPIANELEAIGIYVTPIITPSTRNKMAKVADHDTMVVVDELARSFNIRYLDTCVNFIKDKQIIWVAPSATRQPYLFKTQDAMAGLEKIEPQTMTLLASTLVRHNIDDCIFQAICVVPPRNYRRGLNLFRSYKIGVGEALNMDDARENIRKKCDYHNGRMFEYMFLTNIALALVNTEGSRFICPSENT